MPEMPWSPASGLWVVVSSTQNIYLHANHEGWSNIISWIRKFPNTFLGAAGSCTYLENEEANDINRCTPLARLILETDLPHLKPKDAPWGMMIDPIVAQHIVAIKKMRLKEVLQQCFLKTNYPYHLDKAIVSSIYSVYKLVEKPIYIDMCTWIFFVVVQGIPPSKNI